LTVDYITQQEVGVPGQLQQYLCWSTNYLIDRLKQRLASVVDSFDNRTYYFQALNHLISMSVVFAKTTNQAGFQTTKMLYATASQGAKLLSTLIFIMLKSYRK